MTFEQLKRPQAWPSQSEVRQSCQRLMDFTPNTLSDAYKTVAPLRATYGKGRGVHMLLLLRDPVERAFSEYCMFAQSPRDVLFALRTRRVCDARLLDCSRPKIGACTAERCLDDRGILTFRDAKERPRQGRLYKGFRAARAQILQLIPEAALPDGDVNRTAVALRLLPKSQRPDHDVLLDKLAQLVLPHRDPTCSWGWGWDHSSNDKSFTQIVHEQLQLIGGKGPCQRHPRAALTMNITELTQFVTRCQRAYNFAYVAESLPVFQLALFTTAFPLATWTVVRYEALFESRTHPDDFDPDVGTRLLSRLGMRLPLLSGEGWRGDGRSACTFGANSTRSAGWIRNSFAGGGGNMSLRAKQPMYDHARLSAAVWPWQQVLLELVGRTPGAKLGFGRLLD